MITHRRSRFETIVLAATIISFIITLTGWACDEPEAFEYAHYCFLLFFGTTAGIQMHRHGWNPRTILADKWLIFDVLVIAVALIPATGNLLLVQAVRSARLAHTFRHAEHLMSHLRLAHLFRD
jgi:hypothetical protein